MYADFVSLKPIFPLHLGNSNIHMYIDRMGLEKCFRARTYTRTVINPTKLKIRLRVWLNSYSKVFRHIV